MDKEDNKMGLKRKSKLVEASVDSDDDEPIGALLKLKGKRNSKKSKVIVDGGGNMGKGVDKRVAEDEESGSMDDTLAIFRKKLRGPTKKEGGSAGKDLNSQMGEPSCPPFNELVKEPELDPSLTSKSQKICKGATVVEGSKVKTKTTKTKRSKANSDLKIGRKSAIKEKEDLDLDDEALEDSLSAFVRKVQSGANLKSHGSSRSKQGKEIQFYDDESKTNSGARSEAPGKTRSVSEQTDNLVVPDHNLPAAHDQSTESILFSQTGGNCSPEILHHRLENALDLKQGFSSILLDSDQISRPADCTNDLDINTIRENSDSISLVPRSSSLRGCSGPSGKVAEVKDDKVNSKTIGPQSSSLDEPPDLKNVLDSDAQLAKLKDSELSTSLCEGMAKISDPVKRDCGVDVELDQESPGGLQEEYLSGDHNGPVVIFGNCSGDAHSAPVFSREPDDDISECKSSPMSANESLKYVVSFRTRTTDESEKGVDELEHVAEAYQTLPESACSERSSEDEVINGTSYASTMPDQQGTNSEDRGSLVLETKESNILVGQRATRNIKKHRHGDMAYEGDVDWDVLIQNQDFFTSHHIVDKTIEKLNSSSVALDAENGKAAAVVMGLKARAVGPLEKIKFKEVLKRKGGLQEYLFCRNHILSVWNKDVGRILLLADFGVSAAPLASDSPRASLIRDVFTFLDQYGYINFGVPSEKVENCIKHDLKLPTEEKFEPITEILVAESVDGISSVLRKEVSPDGMFADGNLVEKHITEDVAISVEALEPSALDVHEAVPDDNKGTNSVDFNPKEAALSGHPSSTFSCEEKNDQMATSVQPGLLDPVEDVCGEPIKLQIDASCIQLASENCEPGDACCDSGPRKNIIVVGAGPAGLAAARHLQRQGFIVTVLEARSRIGGRVYTDHTSLSVPVDLGASIITGVEADMTSERRPDPSSLICSQLGLELTVLNSDCPLYDTVTGQKVPADLDETLEAEYNSLLDDMELLVAEKGEHAMKMSLDEGLEYGLKRRHMGHPSKDEMEITFTRSQDTSVAAENFRNDNEGYKTQGLSSLERRVMDWHFAHLEYGCAALLKEVSLPHWNQDDVYGGFGGAHCMIKGGYSTVVESLGKGICIHLDHIVTDISYNPKGIVINNNVMKNVTVSTSNGKEFSGDAVLVTVPLGCLKAETIKFSPPLPVWKYSSIKRLGFGVLNKVVLEFPEVFWDDTIDYFGATAEDTDQRGWCFMFWNVKKTVGAPVLISLVVGKAAKNEQYIHSDHVSHALVVLRKLFGEEKVRDPVASVVTDWGRDPYSYGAYSYVAVGSSGEDYDILGRPVENCLFFAGEATCKEHPDTVGGAMISGLREAVRIIDILSTGTDYTAEVEAIEVAKRHLVIERSEVKDIIRRLDSIEFSSIPYKKSLVGSQVSAWGSTLKDMFFTAKTTAGRLHLAKELLNLPVGFLKTFASTKEGLSTLNSWILDSMGKDGTQLLRHCVRLLVRVSNDLQAVRLSGIGKTVKEKVCVHTSRDIRAIASQLVSVWVELFRKEKASKGGHRLPRLPTALGSKSKSPLVLGSKKVVGESDTTKPHSKSDALEENHEIPMSEEEKAAFAAAEAARAAAIAAAKAYASGATQNAAIQPPKILSFHKFAMREQHVDESGIRKNWSGAAIGKQDCLSEIDSRNCRVRDWSVDFSATGVHLDSSKMSVDNHSQRSHSNEIANQLTTREQSGESVAVDSSILTKAWVDSAGSIGIKDYNAIERWQCQAAAASSGFSHGTMHITDEEDSGTSSKFFKQRQDAHANESSASHVALSKESKGNHPRGADRIKQAVVDYVASLLMPLYKARKIDRDGYKSIMKKTATKVMEQATDAEKSMPVFDFLDFRRKNKIRAFVDTLIERHMATKPDAKSGSSEKT